MRNSKLRHPNAVRSKNVAAKRCTVVHRAGYVFLLDVVRVNHFRVHNLQKSRAILTEPIACKFIATCVCLSYASALRFIHVILACECVSFVFAIFSPRYMILCDQLEEECETAP